MNDDDECADRSFVWGEVRKQTKPPGSMLRRMVELDACSRLKQGHFSCEGGARANHMTSSNGDSRRCKKRSATTKQANLLRIALGKGATPPALRQLQILKVRPSLCPFSGKSAFSVPRLILRRLLRRHRPKHKGSTSTGRNYPPTVKYFIVW